MCSDVGIEPTFQPLDNELLHYAAANREDGTRLDVVAWTSGIICNKHIFYIRVFKTHLQVLIRVLGAMLPMSKKSDVLMMKG